MTETVVVYGQEEEVEAVKLAAASGRTLLQGRDGGGVAARAILDSTRSTVATTAGSLTPACARNSPTLGRRP
jgi:hypothetical protein